MIVNEALAQKFFPNMNPLGQHLLIDQEDSQLSVEIVGVVGSSRHDSLAVAPKPEYYLPLAQNPTRVMPLVFRTSPANFLRCRLRCAASFKTWITTSLCRNWFRWRR